MWCRQVAQAKGAGLQLQERTSHAMFQRKQKLDLFFWQHCESFKKYTAAENEVTALMYMTDVQCFSSKIRQTLP